MESLHSTYITTETGIKKLEVYCCDVTLFDEKINILTTSAYEGSYDPTPHTVFNALDKNGISVQNLAQNPFIDLRNSCHTWLSHELDTEHSCIQRIGCIGWMLPFRR